MAHNGGLQAYNSTITIKASEFDGNSAGKGGVLSSYSSVTSRYKQMNFITVPPDTIWRSTCSSNSTAMTLFQSSVYEHNHAENDGVILSTDSKLYLNAW